MLNVYNSQLDRIGRIDAFESLIWEEKRKEAGNFKLVLDDNEFEIGNIVSLDEDRTGIIERITLENYSVTYFGHDLKTLLAQRVIARVAKFVNKQVSFIINDLVDKEAANPTNADRKIPLLEIGTIDAFIEEMTVEYDHENLLKALSDFENVTYKVKLDAENKKFIFEARAGTDRTAGTQGQIIFSDTFNNLLSARFEQDVSKVTNLAYVKAENDVVHEIGSSTGLDRKELYIKSSAKQEGSSSAEYLAILTSEASTKQGKEIKSFEGEVFADDYVYKQEFDIGDKVTIFQESRNLRVDEYITSVSTIIDKDGEHTAIEFGESAPLLHSLLGG